MTHINTETHQNVVRLMFLVPNTLRLVPNAEAAKLKGTKMYATIAINLVVLAMLLAVSISLTPSNAASS